jgi:hypothetical protein
MDAENRRYLPDVVHIVLQHHPREWSNDSPPSVYKFRCIGRPWGSRWVVHAIWANRPWPPEFRLRNMSILRGLINSSLAEQLGKEVSPWENSLLAWEDE